MSLLPIIFGDSFLDCGRPSRLLDQHFGLCLDPEDFISPLTLPEMRMLSRPTYYRPWRSNGASGDAGSTVSVDKDKFQVNLDVQQFKPEEITVKLSGKNQITVEGKHEEKQDEHGYISRHFVRRYVVPDGFDAEKVVSNLSSDGVLSISTPKVNAGAIEYREIPITRTGQPALEKKKKSEDKK